VEPTQGVEMALPSLNNWEFIFDIVQIGLCGFIILFLILNRIKFKQIILRAPSVERSQEMDTDFVIETVRQQTELAFNHIVETINNERRTLCAVFQQPDLRIASDLLTPDSVTRHDPQSTETEMQVVPAAAIYTEIENLADRGLGLTEISDCLNVSQGEVDLVLKLKHLRSGSIKRKAPPSA
jgi:hypothetical protein